MAKRFAVSVAMLALMLAMAVPAMAQEEVSVTGVLEEQGAKADGTTVYALVDEGSGEGYYGEAAAGEDLGNLVGERVTAYGTVRNDSGSILTASRIEFADGEAAGGQYTVEERAINFELSVEGEPPSDAAFSGSGPLVGLPAALSDEDGDGTYEGSASVEVTVNPDGTTQAAPVAIYGGTGTAPSGDPGEPFAGATDGLVLVDFGMTVLEDGQTLSGSYSFEDGAGTTLGGGETMGGGTTGADGEAMGETTGPAAGQYEDGGSAVAAGIDLNEDGAVDEADGQHAVQVSDSAVAASGQGTLPATGSEGMVSSATKVLPSTGGVLPIAGLAGLLIFAGGLLVRAKLAR